MITSACVSERMEADVSRACALACLAPQAAWCRCEERLGRQNPSFGRWEQKDGLAQPPVVAAQPGSKRSEPADFG